MHGTYVTHDQCHHTSRVASAQILSVEVVEGQQVGVARASYRLPNTWFMNFRHLSSKVPWGLETL